MCNVLGCLGSSVLLAPEPLGIDLDLQVPIQGSSECLVVVAGQPIIARFASCLG